DPRPVAPEPFELGAVPSRAGPEVHDGRPGGQRDAVPEQTPQRLPLAPVDLSEDRPGPETLELVLPVMVFVEGADPLDFPPVAIVDRSRIGRGHPEAVSRRSARACRPGRTTRPLRSSTGPRRP